MSEMTDGFEPWQDGDDWSHFSDTADEEEREWREGQEARRDGMMSETTARERIHQEVYEAYQAGIDHECVPHKYPPMKQEDIAEIADDIIAIVREALLSEEAVSAGNKMCPDYSQNTDAGDVATAMLDAAFGPGKEGG